MHPPIENRLALVRQQRGIPAADLARAAGVSRQTIYAIESGSFVPNTEVALRLAHALEVGVQDLFRLAAADPPAEPRLSCTPLGGSPDQPVRLAKLGSHIVAVPVEAGPYFLPDADGLLRPDHAVSPFSEDDSWAKRLVIAGCDPALGWLAKMVERATGIDVVTAPATSELALRWMVEGKVHIAGSHLRDPETGAFNLPYLTQNFPREDLVVVTFAHWEAGWVAAAGNPKRFQSAADLSRKSVRFVNREPGSGSRRLLDRLLAAADLESARVTGYDSLASGHLAAAYRVHLGQADCCLATRAAAQAFGLAFIPVQSERYDFVFRRDILELAATRALLDSLQRSSLRRKLQGLAGYDPQETGRLIR
jgi:molybdate-binding protein/DNA-binding XRE family transcriptional regulator